MTDSWNSFIILIKQSPMHDPTSSPNWGQKESNEWTDHDKEVRARCAVENFSSIIHCMNESKVLSHYSQTSIFICGIKVLMKDQGLDPGGCWMLMDIIHVHFFVLDIFKMTLYMCSLWVENGLCEQCKY